MLLPLLALNFFRNFRTDDTIGQQKFLKARMQHLTEPSASRFVHLQEMQTVPCVVHRFTSAFIKGQETTPELPPVLPFFIPHPNSCHTVIEQHHMNAVILVWEYLHTQIPCVRNFLIHSHVSFLSAAKVIYGADILCPPRILMLILSYSISYDSSSGLYKWKRSPG